MSSRSLFLFLVLFAGSGAATAAPMSCGEMVDGLQFYLKAHPQTSGTRPQTEGALLNHQPTRDSVAKAKRESRSDLIAMLGKAKTQQSAGDAAGCRATLGGVAWMLKP